VRRRRLIHGEINVWSAYNMSNIKMLTLGHKLIRYLQPGFYLIKFWNKLVQISSLTIDEKKSNLNFLQIRLFYFILFLLFSVNNPVFSQAYNFDFKYHNAGDVKLLVTNEGTLFPNWEAVRGLLNCEYPPNSNEEHIGEAGIWVGGITPDGDTLVSATSTWNPWGNIKEFYPTTEPWDTVWVVGRGDTADISYWPGGKYIGTLSDQNFVCRYNDYGEASLTVPDHNPLYIDVIQVSYAWSSDLLKDMIVFEFYVIPTKWDLKGVYITYWADPNVGYRSTSISEFSQDDYSLYYPDLKLGVGVDAPGGFDGDTYSPIGFQIFPRLAGDLLPQDSINWTFNYNESQGPPGITPPYDNQKYRELMASGIIKENQERATGSHFVLSFGPYDLNYHDDDTDAETDTLVFRVGVVLGEGLEGLVKNAERLKQLEKNDFRAPFAPPSPTVDVITGNHFVTLKWDKNKEIVEDYVDSLRGDSAAVPFEGYRLYKSTYSINGPWTLLAEYDLPDNPFFKNIGLEYEYTDVGLLNNVEYYYTVTAFSKPDTVGNFPSNESSKSQSAVIAIPGTEIQETVGKVAVVPNPYLGSIDYSSYNPPWEKPPPGRVWLEQDRRIQFINLPARSVIKIYTSAGDLVETIEHDDPNIGFEDWNMTSYVVQAIASGIYLFTVEDKNTGKVQVGKFVVIK